jgi:hypothetical protein
MKMEDKKVLEKVVEISDEKMIVNMHDVERLKNLLESAFKELCRLKNTIVKNIFEKKLLSDVQQGEISKSLILSLSGVRCALDSIDDLLRDYYENYG